ncbi:hypothetical protein POPTR_004G073950v4 [Populus trichocarpa]|uniref:Uncharacterized protein n=1 Tax=Populus trichocarpa TaxID=3694 RepID=A0ACC0T402_POPTR|nr:hypothetical protein POPTR_004G073950v4 [Populus trichocarpa]
MEEKKGKKNCHRSDAINSPSTCAILKRAPESILMTSKKIIVARKKQEQHVRTTKICADTGTWTSGSKLLMHALIAS